MAKSIDSEYQEQMREKNRQDELDGIRERLAKIEKWIAEQPVPLTPEQEAEIMDSVHDNYGSDDNG